MTDRPLPSEFDHLFRPERIGSEDPTLAIPSIKSDYTTQEIRGGTQELPAVDATIRQSTVAEPVRRYIPPTPRPDPEHESGERPGNGLLGIAFSFIVGIVAMLAFWGNVEIDMPADKKPRAEQTTGTPSREPTATKSPKQDWRPPASPTNAIPNRITPTQPIATTDTSTSEPPEVPPAPQRSPSTRPEVSSTPSTSPTAEPTDPTEPPPTEEPSDQPTPTPEQPSTQVTETTP